MKLFYSRGACSLVVRIILRELNLDCEFESVDLKTKKTQSSQDFLKINPKGAVPVLQIDSNNFLTENAVILQYLADNAHAYELLPPVENLERYRALEWLNYITTEVHKSFGALFNPKFPQKEKDEIFIPLLNSKFVYLNSQLESKKYLFGAKFSLADAYLFVMLTWAVHFKIDLSKLSSLKRYFEELKTRKSIKEALSAEGL